MLQMFFSLVINELNCILQSKEKLNKILYLQLLNNNL